MAYTFETDSATRNGIHYDFDKGYMVDGSGICYEVSDKYKRKMEKAKEVFDNAYQITLEQFLREHPECSYGVEYEVKL